MASSHLHPYHSYPRDVEHLAMSHVSITQVRTSDGNYQDVSLPRRPKPLQRTRSSPRFKLPPVITLLIFLPIPPLLSLLYLTTGHAILCQIHKTSPSSIYHIPVLSSVEAGATGGLVFSLPFILLLYFIFYHKQQSVPEDFFEDDDSITTGPVRSLMYLGYLASVLFFVGIGGIAGPLGVTCISNGVLNALVISKKVLSPGAAAAAGFLGGAVLSVGLLLLGMLIALVWIFWMRRKNLFS